MRDNRSRRRAQRVLVDGWRETWQAFQAGLQPLGLYVAVDSVAVDSVAVDSDAKNNGANRNSAFEQRDNSAVAIQRKQVLEAAGDRVVWVSPGVMEKIAYGQSARGVVAEFEAPDWGLDALRCHDTSLVLVLDHIEKPGNIGATFRCADAAGVDAVLLTPAGADRFNPNAIRSSLGAVFSVPSAVADEADARSWLAQHDFQICSARVEASIPLWQADLTGRTAIVIGSEAHGLGDHWQGDDQLQIQGVHIPMAGSIDSLNASVSAAVFLYEAARQRR